MAKHLVIFDCDGVLVDSETLSSRAMRELAAEEGLDFSPVQALEFIRGRKVAEWVAQLEVRLGRALPAGFVPEFRSRSAALFATELRPVPHVKQVIDDLVLPFCTASSAPREKILNTLGLTGLLSSFEDRIYSAYEVGVWKPDPGLFLHAAADLGAPARQCAVVEDSLVGVQAGTAAGMAVFGYAPPESGTAPTLAAAGAITFDSMKLLPGLLDQWLTGDSAEFAAR
ncbi:HAD-IA family hydrolase [Streptomyces inhibens]|uniref:HAD-IA family hydrolase n=1 Tax=Streptomyces inhibens TaxID=2293571 RepID=UPI001EE69EA9|nr:HAD-IA family hydrolase [Streptomyces inhibens]UKY53525.1 HAD-IA family hydrolase [Streptomyces inhibens]